MTIIDLSIALEDGLPSDPPNQIPRIDYKNHKDTAEEMAGHFAGATVNDFPEGNGWAIEFLNISTHSGTHLDAPYHYYPTMNHGERAWTIEEIPLEWCIGNGLKMDFSHMPDGYKVTKEDVEAYFQSHNIMPRQGDIVLLQSGAADRWGRKDYLSAGVGMSREATLWLLAHGVRVTGTDGWSWDVPLPYESEEFRKHKDASILWEGHRAGKEAAYCHIEKLTNLDKLPLTGYKVYCFPVKIRRASAGWCRTVAILD